MRAALPALSLCVLLSACFSTLPAPPQQARAYPASVPDFERFDEFPAMVGAYARGEVTAYAPGLRDYSVAYNRFDPLVQSAVTIYLYPCSTDVQAQLEAERNQVLRAHVPASVLSDVRSLVEVGGTASPSDQVVFEYEQPFAGRRQAVVSELVLSNQQGRCLKVRTTAPANQRGAAFDGTRILLKGLHPKR